MMQNQYRNDNLDELLGFIEPSELTYQEWVGIGMALKRSGYDWTLWDSWSARDSARYHGGECERKWRSFDESCTKPVTAGTIVKMALEGGYEPLRGLRKSGGHSLDWDSEIGEDYVVTSSENAQDIPVAEPNQWNPANEITKYIEALFDTDDYVGYVTDTWQNSDGKYLPSAGNCDRTASQLLSELAKCNGDIGMVFGDYNKECGAWICFNPLDGKGRRNENVTEYKYALVESDTLSIERQNGILHELQLPIAALVYSGKKSVHAIVRVDAPNYEEYRKRVDFLYNVCDKNGLKVDRQNRNPARLSRMPGIERGERKQFLIETNIGLSSWSEWKDYIDSVTDDLPEFENMALAYENLPALSPPLIENVLRQGHKMLIAGPSKAGKSFALIELCIAMAEGVKWMGWQCARGRVLYVNLELDRASCLHRFKDVYTALRLPASNISNIDIWNLRGVTEPMDKLAPKLIRRAKKNHYIAVIIDPIYKVITGDENSADQMAHFCNQFDKLCNQLCCAVIYCHHHSKGSQGGKRSMDRASGSGVFARDPDALIDMVELELTEDIYTQEQNNAVCAACAGMLNTYAPDAIRNASPDELLSQKEALKLCSDNLPKEIYNMFIASLDTVRGKVRQTTAWRIEGTLREFPSFGAKNVWFRYPTHIVDEVGVLKDLQTESQMMSYQIGNKRRGEKAKETYKAQKADKKAALLNAFDACNMDGNVSIDDMAEYLGVSRRTAERRVKETIELELKNGVISRIKTAD